MWPGGYCCQDMTERASDYIDDEVGWLDWCRCRLHLLSCSGCRSYVHLLRTTVDTLGSFHEEPLDARQHEDLMRTFRRWKNH